MDLCTGSLTAADREMFNRIGVDPDLLARAGIKRVTDREARQEFGVNGAGDNSGILIPYLDGDGIRRTCRLRRDHPEIENGKPIKKYLAPYGDRRHLYVIPGDHLLGHDANVPVVLVEAEKSALAMRALADRTGRPLLPLALGGCWGWRGRIGKAENPKGERVDEVGPLPELGVCRDGRKVYVLLDTNCFSNPNVRAARSALVRQLLKQKADVHVLDLPVSEGVNGPDDFIGSFGDEAMGRLLDSPPKPNRWHEQLITRETKQGPVPYPILANVLTALRFAPEWSGVLAFNEFSQQVLTQRETPWGKGAGAPWTDVDDSLAGEWMQREARIFVQSAMVAEAVQTVSRENSFHPVREYLERLKWDGIPRLENFSSIYLGCEDSEFVRAVGHRWLISAVARVFQPGCQVDCVLLLEGPQGIKKSSALRALAGDEWFCDHIADLGSKDSRIELNGKWIIEISELAATRRAETEKVKAFLTARADHYRPPYGRRAVNIPRQNVFAASTNDEQPFIDSTGNRRYWPVRCDGIDVEAIRRDRDLIWAEAYLHYKAGKSWWLETPELNGLAREAQEERYEDGVWDNLILDWIENPRQREDEQGVPIMPWYGSTHEGVSIPDILIHAIGKSPERLTQIDKNQVVRCLTHRGWTKKQVRGGPGRGKRYYVPPNYGNGTRGTP